MRILFAICLLLPRAAAGDTPAVHRAAASAFARQGKWRAAEAEQRLALDACRPCSAENRAILRAELAGYLVLGGFPEAAIPLWKQSLAELPADSPLHSTQFLGLGVALQAAGHTTEARHAWTQACRAEGPDPVESAACRFNLAVSAIGSEEVWRELEQLLPTLLAAPGPLSRATVLLQTARAAALAGHPQRAMLLLEQADLVIVWELAPTHPFRLALYDARALVAEQQGDHRQARLWRKKAAKPAGNQGWQRQTVTLEELRGKQP